MRKIDSSIDLSRHLTTIELLPRPWNAALLFGREAPLEVEVGTGKGLFLRTAAAEARDRDFLGIEISQKYARFAAAKLAEKCRPNACIVYGDAQRVFREVLAGESVWVVHVYFPDPWWKKRHLRRRIWSESFARDVERVLAPGGTLHFWTDVESYFQQVRTLLAEHTKLAGPLDVAEQSPAHDLDYRTHYERRTRLEQLPVFRAMWLNVPAAASQ